MDYGIKKEKEIPTDVEVYDVKKGKYIMKKEEYDIQNINLHDEKILGIEIDSKEDFFNVIAIKVKYNDKKMAIKCTDCYSADLKLNMYITGDDTIRSLKIENITVQRKVCNNPEEVINISLKKLIINLNTTNSDIIITAREIKIYPCD